MRDYGFRWLAENRTLLAAKERMHPSSESLHATYSETVRRPRFEAGLFTYPLKHLFSVHMKSFASPVKE